MGMKQMFFSTISKIPPVYKPSQSVESASVADAVVAVVASVVVHPHEEAAVLAMQASALATAPVVAGALLHSQKVAHVAAHHALVPTLVTSLLSPSFKKIPLLPQAAGASLPLRVTLVAELVPTHAGHVVAALLELDEVAAPVAARVLVLLCQLQEGGVFR